MKMRRGLAIALFFSALLVLSPWLTVTSPAQTIPSNVVLNTGLPTAPSEMSVCAVAAPTLKSGLAAMMGVQAAAKETDDALVYESGTKSVVMLKSSDSFIFGDFSKWLKETGVSNLPTEQAAPNIAKSFLQSNGLFPRGAELLKTTTSITKVSDAATGTVKEYRNHVEVSFSRKVDGYWVQGMELRVALGEGGAPIAVVKLWRELASCGLKAPIVDPITALGRLAEMMSGANKIVVTSAGIVYYSLPAPQAQEYVEPYYDFQGYVDAGDGRTIVGFAHRVPALVKAQIQPPTIAPPGDTRDEGTPRADDQERGGLDTMATNRVLGESVENYHGLPGLGNLALTHEDIYYGYWYLTTQLGASNWVGGGRYQDDFAWDSDFYKVERYNQYSDYQYADNVDLAMFSGHGSPTAFYFGVNHPDHVVSIFDMTLGDKDIEWLVLGACQVLQYSDASGNVFARWLGTFKGLHYILSFSTVSYDTQWEMYYFARAANGVYGAAYSYARMAWYLATLYTQPSTVKGAYLRVAGSPGAWDTYLDRPLVYNWQQELLDPLYVPGYTGTGYWAEWWC